MKQGRSNGGGKAWLPIAIALVAVAALAVCAGLLWLGASRDAAVSDKPSNSSHGSDAFATPVQDEGVDGAASSQAASGETSSPDGAADPESLAWRDADFAVDSSRADWNYGTNGRKTVYLTIDDGPSQNTQAVLDILDRYGCKATFFVIGQDPAYFPMIKEAYDRGHTIGLHSMTHDYAQVYSSEDAFFADLDAIGQVVADQIGYVPCFIRFPGGSSNAVSASYTSGIMSRLVVDVQARGYQYYDWNSSVGDGSEHTTEEIIGYGTSNNEDENIMLLLHDSAAKQTTVEALPAIIEHYQALGYSFEAIDRTSWVCHHAVSN